ncbi:CoA transferase [Pseudaminobacter arsenicus]|uniref:CoA transferase n=1 Tax=Borborobacter arsenicus TaxID=1851146 RepID=A0A432V3I9_9HYPH|nr:CoA transferase [Pseudaminobacter arsenicus]RUM96660.1 CoA transferase [Pseudaminobacter arsenicus]
MTLLDSVRIVSFNHFLMGPVGVQHLADLGADVVAIEPIGGGQQRHWAAADKWIGPDTPLFLAGGRNKRSLALDLKSPAGAEIARRLIAEADVVVENYRPGVMDKLGFGFEAVQAFNSRVVYASASGFGADGPYRDRPGQDLLIQAMSGLAAITGRAGQTARPVGVSAVDHHGAALLALGVLAALYRRSTTGKGCKVDVSLLNAAIDLQLESFVTYLNGPRPENGIATEGSLGGWYFPAPYGIYRTADTDLAISLTSLKALAAATGSTELASIDDAKAWTARTRVGALLDEVLARRPSAEWQAIFTKAGIWHAPVGDYESVLADPQVQHNGCFIDTHSASGEPITLVAHPVRYDGAAPAVRLVPQPLGAQSEEILVELGYSAAERARLFEDGVCKGVASPAPR